MAKETAEQKLLRLIEANDEASAADSGAGSSSSPQAQEVLNAVSTVGGAVNVPPVVINVLNFFKNFSAKAQLKEGLGIRQINMVLVIAVVCGLAFFISQILSGMRAANNSMEFSKIKKVDFSTDKLLPVIPDLQRYVSTISFRNIFHPFEKKEPEVVEIAEADAPVVPPQLADKTQNLKLVGVSWQDSADTASAMMENTETGITYFLRNGEKVNGVNVQKIYANSVVLELGGKQMEMKLQ